MLKMQSVPKSFKYYFLYFAICKLWLTHELGRKLPPRFGWYLAAADWKNCRQNKIHVKPYNIYAMQTRDANQTWRHFNLYSAA